MRLLIWDFDGTLGYRHGGKFGAAMLEVLRRERPRYQVEVEQLEPHLQTGFPWHHPDRPHPQISTPTAWWNALTPVIETAYRGIGLEPCWARALVPQVRATYVAPHRWQLFEHALETLDRLSTLGWFHALLSNHVPELRTILDHLDLTGRLVRIFNSAETGYEKPHPKAYQMVVDAFPEATSAWMVGDSVMADVHGAEAAGLRAILLHRRDARARLACRSFSALESLLAEQER